MSSEAAAAVPLLELLAGVRHRWASARLEEGAPHADLSGVCVPADLLARAPESRPLGVFLPASRQFADEWVTEYWDDRDASQKPVRCFSCLRCLGHRYAPFQCEVHERGVPFDEALGALGVPRDMYCCKSMLMSYVSVPVHSTGKGRKVVEGDV